jgi:hypothetical protein
VLLAAESPAERTYAQAIIDRASVPGALADGTPLSFSSWDDVVAQGV